MSARERISTRTTRARAVLASSSSAEKAIRKQDAKRRSARVVGIDRFLGGAGGWLLQKLWETSGQRAFQSSIPPPMNVPLILSRIPEQPNHHAVLSHAPEILTSVRLGPLPSRDPIRSGG